MVNLASSFLLAVDIRFCLFCLQLKICLGFLLRVPPIRKLGLVLLAHGSPTVDKKTIPKQKDLNCK